MYFVAKGGLPSFLHKRGIRIPAGVCLAGLPVGPGWPRCGRFDGGINERPFLQHQLVGLQLPLQRRKALLEYPCFLQPTPEPPKGRLFRDGFRQRQP